MGSIITMGMIRYKRMFGIIVVNARGVIIFVKKYSIESGYWK